MNAEDASNHIFVDFHAESQTDLLGNARAAPVRIPALHFHDRLDQLRAGSFRARAFIRLGPKQPTVLTLRQQMMEVQQRGRFQDDGRTQKAGRRYP